MSKIDFENMLNQHNEKPKLEAMNWVREKEKWLAFIQQFYTSIELWLNPYLEKGQMSYEYEKMTLTEEEIGNYEVNVMKINFASQQVKLEPVGTMLIGSKGRIDMEGNRGRIQFILADKNSQRLNSFFLNSQESEKTSVWTWKIVLREQRKIAFDDFTEENFFNALMEVSNG